MAEFVAVFAAILTWSNVWFAVAMAFCAAYWMWGGSFRRFLRETPDPSRGLDRRARRRLRRLAASEEEISEEDASDVRRLVEFTLRMWDAGRGRPGFLIGLGLGLWMVGLPAVIAILRGRWIVLILLLPFAAILLGVALQAWDTARIRRTAEVNGWLVDGRVADAR